MKKFLFGPGAILLAALLWSVDGLLRRNLYALPPSVVVFWEHTLGLLVLLPIVLLSWRQFKQLTSRQWMAILIVSLLSGALGTILYTAALGQVNYIQYSVVVLLQQTQPIFAILSAAIILKERLTKRFLLLALVAIVSAYFISFPHLTVSLAGQTKAAIAALLALGAAASWAVSTALSKYSLQNTSPLHITAARFFFTIFFALFFVGIFRQTGSLTPLTAVQWQELVAIVFSTGLVALAIYYAGLKQVAASRSAILELVWPLSAILIGYLFLHEHLTITQWLGTIALLASIFFVSQEAAQKSDIQAT